MGSRCVVEHYQSHGCSSTCQVFRGDEGRSHAPRLCGVARAECYSRKFSRQENATIRVEHDKCYERHRYDLTLGHAHLYFLYWRANDLNSIAVLLYLHRNCFARALVDYPAYPTRSPFGPSFVNAYTSATSLLKNIRDIFEVHPHLALRMWPKWGHAIAASVSYPFCLSLSLTQPMTNV